MRLVIDIDQEPKLGLNLVFNLVRDLRIGDLVPEALSSLWTKTIDASPVDEDAGQGDRALRR